MAKHVKCQCGTIFRVSGQGMGQSVCCPACGTHGHVPEEAQPAADGDVLAQYAPCERCQHVRTAGGILCEDCTYELHMGQIRRRGLYRWAMIPAAAAVLVILALIWNGMGF